MTKTKTLRVILWGDNSRIRDNLRQSVTELGYEVVEELSTNNDIVKSVLNNKPDIVLLNCEVDDINSCTISRELQQACSVPVIMLSEFESVGNHEKAHRWGASFFSVKATDTLEIDRAISKTMSRHSALLELQKIQEREKKFVREFSHSVKNNFAMITSLMHLQADSCENSATSDALLDCANRVRVIAAIHEVIHPLENADVVRLDEFLKLVAGKLCKSFPEDKMLTLDVTADQILMGRENAIYYGLIVNELITNAMKHTPPEQGKKKNVALVIKKLPESEMLELIIHDNESCHSGEIDPFSVKSFGLQLVSVLVDQLGGNLEVDHVHGTRFIMRFKAPPIHV